MENKVFLDVFLKGSSECGTWHYRQDVFRVLLFLGVRIPLRRVAEVWEIGAHAKKNFETDIRITRKRTTEF